MALYTKCILFEPTPEDGLRISVMSRHTQNDGITPDLRIKPYHIHMPILGPSPSLIGDYYKRGLGWKEYEKRYLGEIRDPAKAYLVRIIANLAITRNITLLCVEDEPSHCHRRLLAEECLRECPGLVVIHR